MARKQDAYYFDNFIACAEEDELSEAEWFEREDIPYDDYDVSLTREMMIRFKKGLA